MSDVSARSIPQDATRDRRARPWYGLIAVPPPEIVERLRALQEQLAIVNLEPEPHVTLKMPFQVQTSLAEIKDCIARVAASTLPISVSLSGVGSFPGPYSNAIYVAVERNPRLQTFHTALVRALGGAVTDVYPYTAEIELASYVPHVTIASDLPEDQFERLLEHLAGLQVRGRFQMTELQLMRRTPQAGWRVVQRFPLACQPTALRRREAERSRVRFG